MSDINNSPALADTSASPASPASSSTPSPEGINWTPERLESARATWIKAGHDPARFDAAASASGFAPPAADTRSPEQKEHDESFYGPNHRDYQPRDYHIQHNEEDIGRGADFLAKYNEEASSFVAEIGLPPALGAGLVERITAQAKAFREASESERTLLIREQNAAALRHYGSQEALNEAVALAAQCITTAAAGSPAALAFAEAFVKSGAANDVWVLKTLANYARHANEWYAGRSA